MAALASLPRRTSLQRLSGAGFVAAVVLGLGLGGGPARAADAYDTLPIVDVGLTDRVVTDGVSGVAIGGYDPVAYFIGKGAVAGSSQFEAVWNGACWRFANTGNRDAFMADPTVYAPAFGGYDAAAVLKGIATPGSPLVYAMIGTRLYLFRDAASRQAFLAVPQQVVAADASWPRLEQSLAR